MNRPYIVDLSHWDDDINYAELKAHGVEAVIVKATQGDYAIDDHLREHVLGAAAAGLLVGAYMWNDPMCNDMHQAAYFLSSLQGLPVQFLAVDAEQQWADWDEWRAWRAGRIPRLTKIIPPSRISESARSVAFALRGAAPRRPVLIYTRTSFIKEFSPQMRYWVGDYGLWLAAYPYMGQPETTTWEDLAANHTPPGSPTLPAGCTDWRIWQFTGDTYSLNGTNGSKIDVSVWNGTTETLATWVNSGAIIPPGPEPEPALIPGKLRLVVNCEPWLNVRSGPGVNFPTIGRLFTGDTVDVANLAGTHIWAEIEPGKWAAVQLGGRNYMHKAD